MFETVSLLFLLSFVPAFLIFRKAGYSGLQVLLMIIPLVNVIVLFWFALTKWPIERKLEHAMTNVPPVD